MPKFHFTPFLKRACAQPVSTLPLILGLIAATGCFAAETATDTIRVLTYNIHHAQGTDGKLDLDRIAAVIRDSDADIVALQEVDRGASRSQVVDQATELARRTELVALFGANIDLQGGSYGNAILTRLRVKNSENRLLPRHRDGEQRGVLMAVLEWQISPEQSRTITVLATHFDHRREPSERIASAEMLNSMASNDIEGLTILAGDLNATRDSQVLRLLESHWTIAGPELPTIPVVQPTRQIDFVLFRPKQRWSVVETRVIEEAVASDHRALLTLLRAR
jgi:endonuclease/exonuclease/phosphatase family metal-dependent hydrolase